MRLSRQPAFCCALFSIIFLLNSSLSAQNQQALIWFEKGVKSKNSQEKIAAYKKAIAIDPRFREALYNLGMVYKREKNYVEAIRHLEQASKVAPSKLEPKLKAQLMFELGVCYRRTRDFAASEARLREAKSVAKEPKRRAVVSLELGRVLAAKGQYAKAIQEYQAGQQLDPELSNSFVSGVAAAQKAINLGNKYDAAVNAKNAGKLLEAKTLFEQIQLEQGNYRDVTARLATIQGALANQNQAKLIESNYDQARKYEDSGQLEMAAAIYDNLITSAGEDFKDVKSRRAAIARKLEQQKRNNQIALDYSVGMTAIQEKQWTKAVIAFEQVLEASSDYKEAKKQLARARAALENASMETIITGYYTQGVASKNAGDYIGALAAFEKVKAINPKYRNVRQLTAEIESALYDQTNASQKGASGVALATDSVKIDSLYSSGVQFLNNKNWLQATIAFEKVQMLQTGYLESDSLLAQARAELNKSASISETGGTQKVGSPNSMIVIGSAIAVLVFLPVLGFLFLTPTARARFFTRRGKHLKAATIYEGLLARNPGRLKLYSELADIYLLENRSDRSAIDVYRKVLQLNLPNPNRDRMNALVTQNYLTGENADSEAIDALENALKDELSRKKG